jgi:protein phosphatase PTC7
MENLEPIQQTLNEIDKRVPDALRAWGLLKPVRRRSSTSNDIASFLASFEKLWQQVCDDNESRMDVDAALRMNWASCYVRRHDEDAHFGHDETGVVGVADGVGGYRKNGVDAAAFSRGLMTSAFTQVLATEPGTPVCPYTLLERAYEETVASAATGGSTAVILSLAGTALSKWAYIGDSAFAVFRNGVLLHRSKRQQKRFNCPLQLNAQGSGDSIAMAKVGEITVRHGDVLVVGTDGLFDNVFDDDLQLLVLMGTALGFSPKNMADVITGVAYEVSRSSSRDSPYSVDSRKLRGDRRRGGKPDDITVLVAFIVSSSYS